MTSRQEYTAVASEEGYDPSKPLELVQKPAAEPAAAS